jgi:hypothetical protein
MICGGWIEWGGEVGNPRNVGRYNWVVGSIGVRSLAGPPIRCLFVGRIVFLSPVASLFVRSEGSSEKTLKDTRMIENIFSNYSHNYELIK